MDKNTGERSVGYLQNLNHMLTTECSDTYSIVVADKVTDGVLSVREDEQTELRVEYFGEEN